MDKKENIEKITDEGKKRSYVVEGAILKCSCGSSSSTLQTPGRKAARIQGRLQANIMDFKPMLNILPFGYCTARNSACVPSVAMAWINGKKDTWVDGAPALLDISTVMCLTGGTIEIVQDGQQAADINWGRVGEGTLKATNGGLLLWIGYGALTAAGVAALVLTSAVSLPVILVAAGTMAVGGTAGTACVVTGALDVNEGRQDIQYGLAGSDKEVRNPLKEDIGSEAYYNTEMIAAGLSLCAISTSPYLVPFAYTGGAGAVALRLLRIEDWQRRKRRLLKLRPLSVPPARASPRPRG